MARRGALPLKGFQCDEEFAPLPCVVMMQTLQFAVRYLRWCNTCRDFIDANEFQRMLFLLCRCCLLLLLLFIRGRKRKSKKRVLLVTILIVVAFFVIFTFNHWVGPSFCSVLTSFAYISLLILYLHICLSVCRFVALLVSLCICVYSLPIFLLLLLW